METLSRVYSNFSLNIFVCIVFLFGFFSQIGVAKAELVCADPPSQVGTDLLIDATGEIGKLGPLVGAELEGKVSSVVKDLFVKYPNADKLIVVQALTSLVCNVLKDSRSLSDKEKLEEVSKLSLRLIDLLSGAQSSPNFKFVTNGSPGDIDNRLFYLQNSGGGFSNFDILAQLVFTVRGVRKDGSSVGGNFFQKDVFACDFVNFFECDASREWPLIFFKNSSEQIAKYYRDQFVERSGALSTSVDVRLNFFIAVSFETLAGVSIQKRYHLFYGLREDGFYLVTSDPEINQADFSGYIDPDGPWYGGEVLSDFGMLERWRSL